MMQVERETVKERDTGKRVRRGRKREESRIQAIQGCRHSMVDKNARNTETQKHSNTETETRRERWQQNGETNTNSEQTLIGRQLLVLRFSLIATD